MASHPIPIAGLPQQVAMSTRDDESDITSNDGEYVDCRREAGGYHHHGHARKTGVRSDFRSRRRFFLLNNFTMNTWNLLFFLLLSILAVASSSSSALAWARSDILTTPRALQDDDDKPFGDLNALLAGTTLTLPNAEGVQADLPWPLTSLTLDIRNIRCSNLFLSDVRLTHSEEGSYGAKTSHSIDVNVDGVGGDCTLEWWYKYDGGFMLGWIDGHGFADVSFRNSELASTVSIDLTYPSLQSRVPEMDADVEDCAAYFKISELIFRDGSVSAAVADVFEGSVRGVLSDQINAVACEELTEADEQLDGILMNFTKTLRSYAQQADGDGSDGEQVLPEAADVLEGVDEGTNLIDFKSDPLWGILIEQADSFLGGSTTSDDGSMTPKINDLLRSTLLHADGSYTVPMNDISMGKGKDGNVIFSGHDMLTESTITLTSVKLRGLDTFSKFDPLNPVSPQILRNHFFLEELDVELGLRIDMKPSTHSSSVILEGSMPQVVEEIVVNTGVRDVDVTAAVLLALDADSFGTVPVLSILSAEMGCFLGSVLGANFTQFDVTVGDVIPPTLSGFIDSGVDRVLNSATDAAFDILEASMLAALPGFFRTTAREVLNRVVADGLEAQKAKTDMEGCPTTDSAKGKTGSSGEQAESSQKSSPQYADFRDLLLSPEEARAAGASGTDPFGQVLVALKRLLDDSILSIDPETGGARINDLLTTLEMAPSGSMRWPDQLFHSQSSFSIPGFSGSFELGVSNVTIDNLDSIGGGSSNNLRILEPTGPHTLDNAASIGAVGPDKPLRVKARILLALEGDDLDLRNEFDASLEVEDAAVTAALLAKMDAETLRQFPLADVMNPYCWLATVPAPKMDAMGIRMDNGEDLTAAVTDLDMSVGTARLGVDCVSCSSGGLKELSTTLAKARDIDGGKEDRATSETTDMINRLLAKLEILLEGNFLQVKLDRMLVEANRRCPHSPNYEPDYAGPTEYASFQSPVYQDDTGGFMLAIAVAIVCGLAVGFAIALAIRWTSRRKHRRFLAAISEDDKRRLYAEQREREELDKALDLSTKAMFGSPVIPRLVRWFMPLVILGNLALFLSGHLSLGASVTVDVSVASQDMTIDKFFEFSMARSTVDIWKSGAKALAVLIVVFSGLWPYTKQLITFVLWFTPPTWVSVRRRGNTFEWLDILAKWSMIDIFVLIITMAAFRVSVQSPVDQAFFLGGLYSVDLLVVPLWGLYANMIAQLVSQVSSHFIIYYHRRIVSDGTRKEDERRRLARDDVSLEDGIGNAASDQVVDSSEEIQCGPLRKHVYDIESKSGGDRRVTVRRGINAFVAVLAALAASLLVSGCVMPSFRLDVLGLVGVAIEVGQGGADAYKEHSVFTIASLIMEQARYLDVPRYYLGLGCLASLVVITSLVVPLFEMATLVYLWFAPGMTMRRRKRLVAFDEILKAWQYVEVYIISILIATWQLGQISGFMINDVVNGALDDTFGGLVYYGLLSPEDAQPFYVKASVQQGLYLLLCAAILLGILSEFVMRAELQQRHDITQKNLVPSRSFTSDRSDCGQEDDPKRDNGRIKPIVPLRFTDCFRWFMVPINPSADSSASSPSLPEVDQTYIDNNHVAADSRSVTDADAAVIL